MGFDAYEHLDYSEDVSIEAEAELFQSDPFQNKSNINELERRISDIRSGKSKLKEHELIDLD